VEVISYQLSVISYQFYAKAGVSLDPCARGVFEWFPPCLSRGSRLRGSLREIFDSLGRLHHRGCRSTDFRQWVQTLHQAARDSGFSWPSPICVQWSDQFWANL